MLQGRGKSETLVATLREMASIQPNTQICSFEVEEEITRITYGTLVERAAGYASQFQKHGIGPGSVVFIILSHRPDLLYAFLGAILAGCTPAYLAPQSEKQDPGVYRETLLRLFAHTDARAAIVDPTAYDELIGLAASSCMQFIMPVTATVPLDAVYWPEPTPSDPAFLQFSSGTTGHRKGVILTHQIVMEQVRTYAATIGLAPERDRIVSWLPLYHDMGLIACLIIPLATGTPLTLLDPLEWVYEPDRLFNAIVRDGGTLVWLPNFAFNHLARTVRGSRTGDLSGVRAFINCSEPCKIASLRSFAQNFAAAGVREDQLQTCYAMAEAVFAVTQSPLGEPPRVLMVSGAAIAEGRVEQDASGNALISVGTPLPGCEVSILGSQNVPVAADRIGEIAIRGPSVFGGYYRSPAAGAEPFHDGWFRTGDLGFVYNGHLYVTGRIKDVIIAYGRNFYSHDIEEIVSSVPGVKPGRAIALGVFSENAGSEEVVVVAETEEAELVARQFIVTAIKAIVLKTLNLSLAKVMLVEPKWLIKTTSGKISRSQNISKYLDL